MGKNIRNNNTFSKLHHFDHKLARQVVFIFIKWRDGYIRGDARLKRIK